MKSRLPAILLAVLLLAFGPAAAQAKTKAATPPVVTSVAPLSIGIGETLTITGKHFRKGKGKSIVVFKKDKGRAIFVKADTATTTVITVKVPEKLRTYLPVKGGAVGRARFRVRVLTKRLSKAFTALKGSPLVGPFAGGAVAPPPPPPPPDCDKDGIPDDADSDNDLIPDAVEVQIKTDRCNADTDADGVSDAYEYEAALDLNVRAVPYPGKRPYPNPLDANDAGIDYDGDSLSNLEEYMLWNKFGTKSWPLTLNYSDGNQYSVSLPAPATKDDPQLRFLDANHDGTIGNSELLAIDFNADGVVTSHELDYNDYGSDDTLGTMSDDERDADGDGLSNYDETHGAMHAGLWAQVYATERPYPITYAHPDFTDADTDGDGIVDGLDDQDFDGWTNLQELSRNMNLGASFRWALDAADPTTRLDGRTNPYNPCLPRNWATNPPNARDCKLYPGAPDTAPAPFDGSTWDDYAVFW